MFVLRPSSPFKPPPPAVAAEVAEVKPAPLDEPFIDRGLPIPDTYDVDMIRAMLQDPFRIFIYWEVREASLQALTRYFSPEDARTFRVVLKLVETSGGHEAVFEVGRRGRYWMLVFPDREYEFEVGVRSPLHGYIALVRSNRVRTPAGTVSPERAPEQEYQLSPPEFLEILEATGFAAEPEAMMAFTPGEAPPVQTDPWSAALERLPEAVRAALMIAAMGGELTLEMMERLGEPLRTQLMRLLAEGGGRLASIGLMHYLPEIVREAMDDGSEWVGDRVHPLHLAPRFFLGGTENVTWPGGEIHWPRVGRRPSSPELLRGRE